MKNFASVDKSEKGLRIDQFISLKADITRSHAKNMINNGLVSIDKGLLKPNRKLKIGDKISWHILKESDATIAEKINIDILYEDEFILVLNKQSGIVVHPGAGNKSGTLLNGLLFYDQIFNTVDRAGIIHRLDKDTSGVLVVAKTNDIREKLQKQFKERTVSKSYQALVFGNIKDNIHIENYIGRHPKNRKKQSILSQGGRLAISTVFLLEEYTSSSLVKIKIQTGRTHQIRVHLSHIGFPIIGDNTYGFGKKRYPELNFIKRQMLHATSIKFIHPVINQEIFFEAPIPEDMKFAMNFLKGNNK